MAGVAAVGQSKRLWLAHAASAALSSSDAPLLYTGCRRQPINERRGAGGPQAKDDLPPSNLIRTRQSRPGTIQTAAKHLRMSVSCERHMQRVRAHESMSMQGKDKTTNRLICAFQQFWSLQTKLRTFQRSMLEANTSNLWFSVINIWQGKFVGPDEFEPQRQHVKYMQTLTKTQLSYKNEYRAFAKLIQVKG